MTSNMNEVTLPLKALSGSCLSRHYMLIFAHFSQIRSGGDCLRVVAFVRNVFQAIQFIQYVFMRLSSHLTYSILRS